MPYDITHAQLTPTGTNNIVAIADVVADLVNSGAASVAFASASSFGVKGDGISDDTAALASFLVYCAVNKMAGFIRPGTLMVDPQDITVSGDLRIICQATIRNRQGVSATKRTLCLIGDNSHNIFWRGGYFDCNGGAFSGLEINNWNEVDVYIDGAANITGTPASTNSTSALSLSNAKKFTAGWGRVSNFTAGTNTQGSVPRVFSASANNGLKMDGTVTGGDAYNVHGTVVIGDLNGGTARIKNVSCDTHVDNFIYNVGNANQVVLTGCNSIAGDEVVVNTGTGRVIWIGGSIEDFTNAAADWAHAGSLMIIGAHIRSNACGSAFKSRNVNTTTDEVIIRGCTIDVTPSGPDDYTTGKINKFVFEDNRYVMRYDATRRLFPNWLSFGATCDEFSICGNTFELYDAPGTMPAGDFFINLPSAVTQLSHWKGNRLLNKTGRNDVNIRINNARQQLVHFDGVFSVSNISSEGEVNRGAVATAAPRVVYGTAVPTSGYWQQGSQVINPTAQRPNSMGWWCAASGTPGTWHPLPSLLSFLRGIAGNQTFSLAAGASTTTIVTVTGAGIGDMVTGIGFGAVTNGLTFSGEVTDFNQVTVTVRNPTASTITTATASLRVNVMEL